ncbi:MAG: hypothetical protein CM15mV86_110 [uncultured marine virus]|nr:MAG: hypothetical protein CM15mV86_110 [uncultured marine virus]
MSNYSKTTDFEAKDSLPTGDSGKIIRGSEFETSSMQSLQLLRLKQIRQGLRLLGL